MPWSSGTSIPRKKTEFIDRDSDPEPKWIQSSTISRPINVIDGFIYGTEPNTAIESWRLSQYGLTLIESEDGNALEWRKDTWDGTLTTKLYEKYEDATEFAIETIGRGSTGEQALAIHSVTNSDIINSAHSKVTWAGVATHDGAPYFYVNLRRGTSSASTAWRAEHDGTLKQAWFGATPVAKAGATTDLKDALVAYGLLTDGGATPLNLDGGALTVGSFSAATLTATTAFIGPIWRPASDSTTALRMQNAAGTSTILTVDTTNLGVGINKTATPGTALTATKFSSAAATSVFGLDVDAGSTVAGANAVWGMRAIGYAAASSGSQTGTIYGLQVAAINLAANSVSALTGNYTAIGVYSTGNVTNGYAMFIAGPTMASSGTLASAYGLYIGGQKVAGVTTGVSMFQAGASDLNYWAGETGFNSANWTLGQVHIVPSSDTKKGLVIRGASSQSVPLLLLQNNATNTLAQLDHHGAIIVNEQGADADSRFEGDTDQNLTFWDASTDRVGIGTNSPSYKLHIAGDLNLSSTYVYRINGTQLIGAQGAAVADASGGATVDAEARTALNALLARLRTHGLIAT